MTNKKFLGKTLPVFYTYVGVLFVTLLSVILLLVWTISGDAERALTVRKATLVVNGTWQEEYLVGQQVNLDGVSLNIGTEKKPKLIAMKDCTITADFISAGKNHIEISYKTNEYTMYSATRAVNVLQVRALEVEHYSSFITAHENSFTPSEDFKGYAILASKPSTDAFGEVEKVENGWKVALKEDMFSSSCSKPDKTQNFYSATLYCGTLSHSFNFYNAAGQSFIVTSSTDVVKYDNSNAGSTATLSLVVTDRSTNYQTDCTGSTKGYYIYTDIHGEERTLPFAYTLEEKDERLQSAEQTAGLTETVTGENEEMQYTVQFDGNAFGVNADVFQSAVVGGRIFEDHGYKLVVGAKERILHFDYTPVDTTDEKDPAYNPETSATAVATSGTLPTLTLYVTEYDMNPLLGTGNGFSRGVYIYTDREGVAHKMAFYLQAWVWTYVPLSQNYSDVYDQVTVSDFVYNHEAPSEDLKYNSYHCGTLYATVSQFVRGEGIVTERFSIADELDGGKEIYSEDKWLFAIMGM